MTSRLTSKNGMLQLDKQTQMYSSSYLKLWVIHFNRFMKHLQIVLSVLRFWEQSFFAL